MFSAPGALTYSVQVQLHNGKYVAKFPALPACHAAGETYEEALEKAQEALVHHVDRQLERGLPIVEEPITSSATLSITVRRPIISAIEASKRFGLTNDYITRLCRKRKIRSVEIGHAWFLNEDSLRLYLEHIRIEEKKRHRRLSEQIKKELATER